MTPRQRLDALINLMIPEIRDAFHASISNVVDSAILAQIVEAVEAGDYDRAFALLGYSRAAMRPLLAIIDRSFERSGDAVAATYPTHVSTPAGKLVFRFDVRNPRAEQWLRDKSSELITRIENDVRVNIRNTLFAGIQEGRNPRSVALDIVGRVDPSTGKRVGGVVGLTQQQEAWARSARQRLLTLDPGYLELELRDKRFDAMVEKAIADGKPLPIETVDKLITRYKDKALKFRGEQIARTEALQSMNAAEFESAKQAVAMGAVQHSAVQREWQDVHDNRVRWSHKEMDGQVVGLDEPFVSPSGALMMFPGDNSLGAPGKEVIACRCRAKVVIDWMA